MPIYVVGFFYIIYFIKEVKVPVKEGIDDVACEIESTDQVENQNESEKKRRIVVLNFLILSFQLVVLKYS